MNVRKQELGSVVVICGATASAKASVARRLAKRLGGEIVSADSRKVYRGLDVGTAKPGLEARRAVAHHLIDVVDPGEHFDASMFVDLADRAIEEITLRGNIPLVVGGTGLYIRSLLKGIIRTPDVDETLRKSYMELERREPGVLHKMLLASDPKSAARIGRTDVRRLVRALEVLELTGKSISWLQQQQGLKSRYRSVVFAIRWSRDELYSRINERVLRMMAAGWLDETISLMATVGTGALDIVGYRQLVRYLRQECSLSDAVKDIQKAHRRYARQQLKWFRADADVEWIDAPVDLDMLAQKVEAFMGL